MLNVTNSLVQFEKRTHIGLTFLETKYYFCLYLDTKIHEQYQQLCLTQAANGFRFLRIVAGLIHKFSIFNQIVLS